MEELQEWDNSGSDLPDAHEGGCSTLWLDLMSNSVFFFFPSFSPLSCYAAIKTNKIKTLFKEDGVLSGNGPLLGQSRKSVKLFLKILCVNKQISE